MMRVCQLQTLLLFSPHQIRHFHTWSITSRALCFKPGYGFEGNLSFFLMYLFVRKRKRKKSACASKSSQQRCADLHAPCVKIRHWGSFFFSFHTDYCDCLTPGAWVRDNWQVKEKESQTLSSFVDILCVVLVLVRVCSCPLDFFAVDTGINEADTHSQKVLKIKTPPARGRLVPIRLYPWM